MQLNVLNDLAEAMKALDGKKQTQPGLPACLVPCVSLPAWPTSCRSIGGASRTVGQSLR